jgi:ATP-binding cassette subfamily F protein uup
LKEQSFAQAPRAPAAATETRAPPVLDPPVRARKPGRLSFLEQREMDGIEEAILTAEERKSAAEAALSDPATYQKGGDGVVALRAEMDAASAEVERLYARWAELAAWMSSTR